MPLGTRATKKLSLSLSNENLFNGTKPTVSHSGQVFLRVLKGCSLRCKHCCKCHKQGAVIRKWDTSIYHVYRDINSQLSLSVCTHHIPNMIKVMIRGITGIIKPM